MKKIRYLRIFVMLFILGFLFGCPQEPTTPIFLDVAITDPQEQITCIRTTREPEPCSFDVRGTSTRVVSEPDVGIYVLVQPVRPSAGGIFIQLPAATVQEDGQWSAKATLEAEDDPIPNGATLNIQAVIAERDGGIETQAASNPIPGLEELQGTLVFSDPVNLTVVVPTPTPLPSRRSG